MGKIIDNHLSKVLFLEKNVNYHNDIYNLLYGIIWPSVDNFLQFLSSSDISLKIKYAKRIYDDFALSNDLFLPPALMRDVLQDQINKSNLTSDQYIPQDHIIHSINLYIFGVYAFFSMQYFNNAILKDCNNNYEGIKDFILKWQIFSLFHDVGYYFESGNGNLDSYNKLCDELIHYSIIKNIAKTLACKFMADNSKSVFSCNALNINDGGWRDELHSAFSNEELLNVVQEFDGFTLAEGICNDEDMKSICPFISNKYLITVVNEYGEIIAVLIKDNELQFENKLCKLPYSCNNFIINNVVDITQKKYKFKYYIKDLNNSITRTYNTYKGYKYRNAKREFPRVLFNYLSLNKNDISKVLYAINAWLIYAMPFNINEHKKYMRDLETCYKNSMIGVLKEKIVEKKFEIEKDDRKKIKDYLEGLINTTLVNEVFERANLNYNRNHGAIHDIYMLYEYFKNHIKIQKNELQKIMFFDTSSKVLKFNKKFSYNESNTYQYALYNSIKCLADRLNIKLDDLLKYKPKYTDFDHGLVSACLLFQAAATMNLISSTCAELQALPFLQVDKKTEEHNIKVFSEAIFSVLLHNIYTKESQPKYGVDYAHSLDVNPFSYFCAFCDTVQKWGRPKLMNQSKMELADINYLEDNFDIDVIEDRLIIICEKKNLDNLESTIMSSETFLPGISWLVNYKQI